MGGPASARQSAKAPWEAELAACAFIPLIVVDEVGDIPFDPEAANLMFSLVFFTIRASSPPLIVTSKKAFLGLGGDLRR